MKPHRRQRVVCDLRLQWHTRRETLWRVGNHVRVAELPHMSSDAVVVENHSRANLLPAEFDDGVSGCGAIAAWFRYWAGRSPALQQKLEPARELRA